MDAFKSVLISCSDSTRSSVSRPAIDNCNENEKEYEYSASCMVQYKITCLYWYNTQFNK